MDSPHAEVGKALSLLESERLRHPLGCLISLFVTEAVDPRAAADFVIDTLAHRDASSLVSDWRLIVEALFRNGSMPPSPDPVARGTIARRDGKRCCVSGRSGPIWDPLEVVPILRVPEDWIAGRPHISDMLGAFFGPQYRDWWLAYAGGPQHLPVYSNHWLIRRSVASSFDHGFVKLDRLQPSMTEYHVSGTYVGPEEMIKTDGNYALLGDHSRRRVPTVDPRIVGTHARLAKSIRFIDIDDTLRLEQSRHVRPDLEGTTAKHEEAAPGAKIFLQRFLGFGLFTYILLTAWRLFPQRFRAAGYESLGKLGKLLYGRSESSVQRLPFRLYLKYHGDAAECRNEVNALKLVHGRFSFPTPKALDVVYGDGDSMSYLLMTRVPGLPLHRCLDVMSDDSLGYISHQLVHFLAQMRDIPRKDEPSGAAISDTAGEPCRDPRLRGGQPLGPFPDEEAFSQFLMFPDHPSRRGHGIYLTHADLNPRNILVHQVAGPTGRLTWGISGIVDWETAGYYPEYWEYTKAMFERFRWPNRYNEFVTKVFKGMGDYSMELETEIESWENGDGV